MGVFEAKASLKCRAFVESGSRGWYTQTIRRCSIAPTTGVSIWCIYKLTAPELGTGQSPIALAALAQQSFLVRLYQFGRLSSGRTAEMLVCPAGNFSTCFRRMAFPSSMTTRISPPRRPVRGEPQPFVSNTTPIINLVGVGRLDLLPALFGSVVIADSVADEYHAGRAVGEPTLHSLSWLQIVPSVALEASLPPQLGKGESATLSLALSLNCRAVLLDETYARRSRNRGLCRRSARSGSCWRPSKRAI